MDKILQVAIEIFGMIFALTCGIPSEDTRAAATSLISANAGVRFACVAQIDDNDIWLSAGKIFKINDADVDQLPEFN